MTSGPSSSARGLRLISTANSSPLLRRPVQLLALPHGPDAGVGREAVAVGDVAGAEALGNQHFDRLADQFLAAIAEHPLRLRVDEDDPPGPVHEDHGVGRRLD